MTALIIDPMPAPQVELDELYRMSIDQYHRLTEAGLGRTSRIASSSTACWSART